MHVCRLNERQQVDLLSCRLCGRAVVFLCLTVICVDLCVQCIKDDAILYVPCRLCGISVCRTGRGHGRNTKFLEDGIVIVIVRRECADKFCGNGCFSCGDFSRSGLFDLLIGGVLVDGLFGDVTVVCPIATVDVPKLPFRECLSLLNMSRLVDADLGGIDGCACDGSLCRKGCILILYMGCRDGDASLCLDACAAVFDGFLCRDGKILAGVEQGVSGILDRVGTDIELTVCGNDARRLCIEFSAEGIHYMLLCVVG